MTAIATRPRRPTVRSFLLWLVLACLLPGVLGAIALSAWQYRQSRATLATSTILTARALVQASDNLLLRAQALAQAMALSPSLASGDLARFHAQAREAANSVGLGTNAVLRDAAGRQLANTGVDFGQPLTNTAAPERVSEVFSTGRPVISDLFDGAVLRRKIITVNVPVFVDGKVRYALEVVLLPEHFNAILAAQKLPRHWAVGLLDRSGVVAGVANSQTSSVGQPADADLRKLIAGAQEGSGPAVTRDGRSIIAFYSRSPATQWTMAIGIPRELVYGQAVKAAAALAGGFAALFVVGLLAAWFIGGRIGDSLRGLSSAASALGAGAPLDTQRLVLREADEVATALRAAARLLAEREATQKASETRFKALADNIAQLAWMSDSHGAIVWFNRRWHEYTGATPEAMQGGGWQRFMHPEHVGRALDKFRRQVALGDPWEDTFPLRDRDGNYRWFLSRAFPLRDAQGHALSWFGTHTDVTEQLQAQQALHEADKRKDEFIAVLAHELRNPLAPVRTAVEILRRSEGETHEKGRARERRAREVIDRQISHMARLIDDLLDVSRIARGKLALKRERCDLAAIVRQTAEDYRVSLEAAGLELQAPPSGKPLWVDGDAVRLAQMIGNLLNNAGRFTERGGRIDVLADQEPNQAFALVRVCDSGIGIEPGMLPRLFDPFSQGEQDLARSKGGLGLGLALTRGLVELHGGSISAFSAGVGQGAEFTLRLPLSRAGASPAPPARPGEKTRALRVLVIEDNTDAADSLSELLGLAGHEVRVAYDGERGLEMAHEFRPDVVISDIGLPGAVDGYTVARALRADADFAGVYLIALSGYASERARQRAREVGFDAHMAKPADLQALREALSRV
ncbi:MAG TPA: ATP-binding protein [Ramlibacter sp.]|nr:ATP-binding protein [Ramlibacter sp.]